MCNVSPYSTVGSETGAASRRITTQETPSMWVNRRPAKRCHWSWFNKKSMLWIRVYKMVDTGDADRWALTRGNSREQGYKVLFFPTLGAVIAALYDHELDSLIEKLDVPAMLLIAMAADDGEAQ